MRDRKAIFLPAPGSRGGIFVKIMPRGNSRKEMIKILRKTGTFFRRIRLMPFVQLTLLAAYAFGVGMLHAQGVVSAIWLVVAVLAVLNFGKVMTK